VPQRGAEDAALVALLELVAIERIVQGIGEVGSQQEAVIEAVERQLGVPERGIGGKAEARRPSAKVWVDISPPADETAIDGSLGMATRRLLRMDTLNGRRILILEEQLQIALLLAGMLQDIGCEVVGPAKDVPNALALIAENALDAAILDVKIAGQNTLAVADELIRRGTPFAFASGNKNPASIKGYAPVPLITKPYSAENIHRVLCELIEGRH
jgi:CheY-like chemotaxis protein